MNADKVLLIVCGADAAGYVAIVGQGFVQVVGNHRILNPRRPARLSAWAVVLLLRNRPFYNNNQ